MKNFIQPGKTITFTNGSSALASGATIVIGALVAIACAAYDALATGCEAALEGVFEVDKDTSDIAQGAKVYWDASAGKFTTTAGANLFAGHAFEAAGTAATKLHLRLSAYDNPKAAVIAALGETDDLAAPDGGTASNVAAEYNKAGLDTAFDSKVDVTEMATFVTAVEARLDAIEAKIDATLVALKNAGLMAAS